MLAGTVRMTPQRAGRPAPGDARPSGAEIRATAERLVRERDRPLGTGPDDELSAAPHELAPADEERIEAALVGSAAGDHAADDARGGPDDA
jgi:hypothetical protein